MDNQQRITPKEHFVSSDLWQQLDDISDKNMKELIDSLQKYTSNGFFGAAAELSDTLESSSLLNNKLEWKMEVEQERMKRYYSLGFEKLMIQSSNRILALLKQVPEDQIEDDYFLLCQATAIGHRGWVTSSITEMEDIIERCKLLKDKFKDQKNKLERISFIYASEARLAYLQRKVDVAASKFLKAIHLSESNGFLRSAAHIKIIYAQHLTLDNEWDKVIVLAEQFLNDAAQVEFKTHLLLRAFILLLQAREQEKIEMSKKDLESYAFRYQLLLYAMGLSQSQDLNPLLAKAKSMIPQNKTIDFYNINLRSLVTERIRAISDSDTQDSGEGFEKIIGLYYKLLGYEVIDLPANFTAFDLIVIYTAPGGERSYTGIQVKAVNERIYPEALKNYSNKILRTKVDLESGKYTQGKKIVKLESVHWYTFNKFSDTAMEDLVNAVRNAYPNGCEVRTTTLDELVDIFMGKTEILVRLMFSKELEKGFKVNEVKL